MTEDNNIIKKKSYKKKDKYQKEQDEIVKKLNDILGLDDNNNKFILDELKQDTDKQNKILALEEDVKKYFVYGDWGCFRNPNTSDNTKAISLARAIYKNTNYNVNYKLKMKNKLAYTEYTIEKKLPLG